VLVLAPDGDGSVKLKGFFFRRMFCAIISQRLPLFVYFLDISFFSGVIFALTYEFIIADNYLSPINAVFIIFIVNVCCSKAFILKKSIVSEPMLLTAAELSGNSQKRKELRKKRAKQTWIRLRNFYMAIFISKFFQTTQST